MVGLIIGIGAKVVLRTYAGLWLAGAGCLMADKIQNKVANVKARKQAKKEAAIEAIVRRVLNK